MAKQISFSQLSVFHQCKQHWKLKYIDKFRDQEPSIFACFGTSLHETIQHYLTVMYEESAKKADEIDLKEYLFERMKVCYKKDKERANKDFSSPKELKEFWLDGIKILREFKKKRRLYYTKKKMRLLSIEMRLSEEIQPGVNFIGFVDVVCQDTETGEIYIDDIKTSTRGWKNEKKDPLKKAQLLLYKDFYSREYNVPHEMIHVRFLIMKRKVWEEADFPQKRIQEWSPPNGKVSINKARKLLQEFVDYSFTEEGEYNLEQEYEATPGEKNKNCRWCPFKNRPDLCKFAKN